MKRVVRKLLCLTAAFCLPWSGAHAVAEGGQTISLQDPSLEGDSAFSAFMSAAIRSDPKVLGQRSRVEAAEYALGAGRSAYRPQVSVRSGAYGFRRETDTFASGSFEEVDTQVVGALEIEQVVYDGGRRSAQHEIAELNLALEQEKLLLVQRTVAMEVMIALTDLLEAQRGLELWTELAEVRSRLVGILDQSVSFGYEKPISADLANVQLQMAEAQQMSFRLHVDASRRRMKAFYGRAPDIDRLKQDFSALNEQHATENDLRYAVEHCDPQTRIVELKKKIRVAERRYTAGLTRPRISVAGDVRATTSGSALERDLWEARVGVAIQIPIYQGGQRHFERRRAGALISASDYDLHDERRSRSVMIGQLVVDQQARFYLYQAEVARQNAATRATTAVLSAETDGLVGSYEALRALEGALVSETQSLSVLSDYWLSLGRIHILTRCSAERGGE